MAVKKCCVEKCDSCSTRNEDKGVTYHKYPKDETLREMWIDVTRMQNIQVDPLAHYVCSRHFRKNDFQSYEGSKYILKSDAIPSIFPWNLTMDITVEIEEGLDMDSPDDPNQEKSGDPQTNTEPKLDDADTEVISLNDSKDYEGESLEAIQKFIEKEEKEILQLQTEVKTKVSDPPPVIKESDIDTAETSTKTDIPITFKEESTNQADISSNKHDGNVKIKEEGEDIEPVIEENVQNDSGSETKAVASAVLDIILNESEGKIPRKDVKKVLKASQGSGDKGSSMALSVGSRVEAKDFCEQWHAAEIVEVDYDEMEVLVRYEHVPSKHDEWISVSSPRLRPKGSGATDEIPPPPAEEAPPPVVKEEPKAEKPKVVFEVGDRCLARWRDNRRFMATVHAELGDGQYEVIFDDGVHWTCNISRLHKMREPTGLMNPITDAPSTSFAPLTQLGPTSTITGLPYHTHLFDPARDYLGSKSERRERKRKLNIKEIFNIGQKKKKVEHDGETKAKVDRRPRIIRRKVPPKAVKKEPVPHPAVPDAVAAIIGTTVQPEEPVAKQESVPMKEMKLEIIKLDPNALCDDNTGDSDNADKSHSADESVIKEDAGTVKSEDKTKSKPKDVLEKIENTITQLEEIKQEITPKREPATDEPSTPEAGSEPKKQEKDKKKSLSKIKKAKKLRLLHEKRVKQEVERVKSELEAMKKQVEEMKKKVGMKAQREALRPPIPLPESSLLPHEWSCKWVNGHPVGTVSEMEPDPKEAAKGALPRRSVQVNDHRLPSEWTKHLVRRSYGNSAGQWDVVLVSPDFKRFHTKTDMRNYLEQTKDSSLKPYEEALLDFSVHRMLARRLGWDTTTEEQEELPASIHLPAGTTCANSPLVNKRKLSLNKSADGAPKMKRRKVVKKRKESQNASLAGAASAQQAAAAPAPDLPPLEPLEEGYVYVGSLKVQILENLLRCPAEACFKNFRNNTLLQMHIKHYHRELIKMMGSTPKVLDLASARSKVPIQVDEQKTPKVKIPKQPKRLEETKVETPTTPFNEPSDIINVTSTTPVKEHPERPSKTQDSPRLRNALISNKPVKRPRVLLPVRRQEEIEQALEQQVEETPPEYDIKPLPEANIEQLDFESAISTHTVTKSVFQEKKRKGDKKGRTFASISQAKAPSEEDEWNNSDFDTRSSFPRSCSPDSKDKMDTPTQPMSSESNEMKDQYMYTETGERIKIVHMKREEIINCHCGIREEDGLMIQCELCLCWQHALCHNIQKEAEVPAKYTCSICLNPRRGRRSQRFLHDQDRLYEGLLPGARACEALRRSHELSGNLLRIEDSLHALRVKYQVAVQKNHPKLYLWSQDWESSDLNQSQDRLNQDYMELSAMISDIGKENLPVREASLDGIRSPVSEERDERFTHRDSGQLGSQALLSGLLSSPGGASLDLPISTSELERLAKSVQEAESQRVVAPQPEAPIENSVCRERLLKHIQRCQAMIDSRLDSIEAQVAELESQDPSFEDDETAEYFPRTKQTIQMLMRDLDNMEELGIIT